ncbi:hypothetical protein [Streptomyces longisporoflavus]|uniref:Uncharacterized protein n=1 Tax=Streptomyces longisporoflavus TaxID=28044 RepID=A0ABW7QJB5_9ACTN
MATHQQGQLLTGAYWLEAAGHLGDECKWCMQLVPDSAKSEQRARQQAE